MGESSFEQVESVVRTIAETAVENEKYFGDLDAVVGDGDFGYSLARGFELVVADFDTFDRTDIGAFLKKIAVVITSRVGGTSGPIWGTAFLRAGVASAGKTEITGEDAIAMLGPLDPRRMEGAPANPALNKVGKGTVEGPELLVAPQAELA